MGIQFQSGVHPKNTKAIYYWYADSVLETNQQRGAVYRLEISDKMAGVLQDWTTTLPCDDRLHLTATF